MSYQLDKWTVCLASLVLPGSGQLLSKRWSGFAWLLGAVAMAFWVQASELPMAVRWLLTMGQCTLSIAAAWDAKRELEPASNPQLQCCAVGPIQLRRRNQSVECRFDLHLVSTASDIWSRVTHVSALQQFDPLHHEFRFEGDPTSSGTHFEIEHRCLGFALDRVGRILVHRPGQRFALSDLSRLGPAYGFPHVLFFDFEDLGPSTDLSAQPSPQCRLTVACRGKWTSRVLPLCLGKFWIRAIAWEHRRLLLKLFPVQRKTTDGSQ